VIVFKCVLTCGGMACWHFTAICFLICINLKFTIHFLNTTSLPIGYDRLLGEV